MSSLSEVLGHKFNHTPGICTQEQPDGSMAITQWPEALGPVPTAIQIATWTGEYDAVKTDLIAMAGIEELPKPQRALIIWLAGKFALTPAAAKAEIVAILKTLS